MILLHLTGQVMDKVSGGGFMSQRRLHPQHLSSKQRKGGKKKEAWRREKLRGAEFKTASLLSKRHLWKCLYHKRNRAKQLSFQEVQTLECFCPLLFEVTLHESALGWAASSQASPELKGPPISFPWRNAHWVSTPIHRPACLFFFASWRGIAAGV